MWSCDNIGLLKEGTRKMGLDGCYIFSACDGFVAIHQSPSTEIHIGNIYLSH